MRILTYLTVLLFLPVMGFSDIGDSPPSKMYLDFEEGILNYQIEREVMMEFEIKEMLSQGENLLSVDNFLFLLEHAIKFKELSNIEVIVRFPNHVFGQPESLAGIDELRKIAKESIVVATADLRHYGVNYGIPLKEALPIGEEAMELAQREVQYGLDILKTNDLLKFRDYCYKSISDAFEVGQILHTLLGPLESHIHNLRLVDVSD
jgi:hypothetical protein